MSEQCICGPRDYDEMIEGKRPILPECKASVHYPRPDTPTPAAGERQWRLGPLDPWGYWVTNGDVGFHVGGSNPNDVSVAHHVLAILNALVAVGNASPTPAQSGETGLLEAITKENEMTITEMHNMVSDLSSLLSDEDLTDDKLRAASEDLLPRIHDLLIRAEVVEPLGSEPRIEIALDRLDAAQKEARP